MFVERQREQDVGDDGDDVDGHSADGHVRDPGVEEGAVEGKREGGMEKRMERNE